MYTAVTTIDERTGVEYKFVFEYDFFGRMLTFMEMQEGHSPEGAYNDCGEELSEMLPEGFRYLHHEEM